MSKETAGKGQVRPMTKRVHLGQLRPRRVYFASDASSRRTALHSMGIIRRLKVTPIALWSGQRYQAAVNARAAFDCLTSDCSTAPSSLCRTLRSRMFIRKPHLLTWCSSLGCKADQNWLLHGLVLLITLPAICWGSIQTRTAVQANPVAAQASVRELSADFSHTLELTTQTTTLAYEALDAYQPLAVVGRSPDHAAFIAYHTVAAGETLGSIAQQYGLPVATIIWSNSLDQGDMLAVGEQLRIPRIAGLPHIVGANDTVESLAQRYRVSPEAIIYFEPNQLKPNEALPLGRELFIPGGSRLFAPELLAALGGEVGLVQIQAVEAAIIRENQTNLRQGPGTRYDKVVQVDAGWHVKPIARHGDWLQVELPIQGRVWVLRKLLDLGATEDANLPETADFPPPPPIWVWPTRGSISSGFGARWGSFHNGLDISNRSWTPIVAARDGQVIEAGWCRGYGFCVKIAHDGGIITEYGHMIDTPVVDTGETVEAGQLIGHMGSTYDRSGGGYSTGVHLHFTVKINGKAVNPLSLLP